MTARTLLGQRVADLDDGSLDGARESEVLERVINLIDSLPPEVVRLAFTLVDCDHAALRDGDRFCSDCGKPRPLA